MKEILKKYAAYGVAALVFIVLACAYCFPVLKGEVVYAGDNVNAEAAVQESVQYARETGDHSWWTGSMFSGMPNFQIGGGLYKADRLLSPLKSVLHKGHSNAIWVLLIYFICFFILLRSFGVDKWLSIVGAVAIALSSYFIVIIAAGHNGKTSTIALMAVVAAGMYLIFRKKYALGACFAMVFAAAGYSTHPQMAYYMFLMMGLMWLAELAIHIKEKRLKDFGIATAVFALSVALGLGTGCANVFANAEYASETMRGGHSDLSSPDGSAPSKGLDIEYATQWSYGIDETMSFLIPGFKGGSNSMPLGKDSRLYKALVDGGIAKKSAESFCQGAPLYWGEQPFTAGNVYMGAIVCFLFLLGLLIVEGPYKWALLAATLFSTALAWGHNCMWLTEFFFKYFPLYNKFRAVSSVLIVAEIAMPLLGFLALKALIDGSASKEKAGKAVLQAGGITAGICLLFALFGGSLCSGVSSQDAAFVKQIPDWVYAAIIDQRIALLRGDSLRSALFIAAAALTVWAFVKGKLKKGWMVAILGVLILCDMWPVDRRYFNNDNFVTAKQNSGFFAMQPYEELLLKDPDPHFRVMNLATSTFNDARTSYRLKSVGGYSAAKLRRYQDLIDVHLSKVHLPVIGMLNAKYIITSGEDGKAVPQLNPYALGNAWFVSEIYNAQSPDEEIEALGKVDLKTTAVIGSDFAQAAGPCGEGEILLSSYTPKSLDYACESETGGIVVFSEIYYPYGWKAWIDGEKADIFRANYTLRALNVPAGQHNIHFEFDPDSVRKGDSIAMVCTIVMYLIVIAAIVFGIIKRKKNEC